MAGKNRITKIPADTLVNKNSNRFYLMLSTLVINLLALAMPIMMLQTYDRILPSHGIGTLVLLISGVACAVTLEVGLRLARSYLTGWSGAVFEHKTACAAMSHLLNANVQAFEKQGAGAYIQKMAAITRLRSFYSGQALMTMVDLPFVITFLVLIGYIGGDLVFVPLTLFILFCIISWIVGIRLKQEVKEQDFSDKIRYNFLIETLTGIHSIKSQGLEKFFFRRNDRLQNRISAAHFQVALSNNIAMSSGMLFGQIMTVSVVSYGAIKVLNGDMGTGGLAACLLLSGRVMQPVQRALGLWTRFQSFFIDKKELEDIFALPGSSYGDTETVMQPTGLVSCRNLSFSYGEKSSLLFDDINLSLRTGQSISLIGEQGSGRTTFINLLTGLYKPTEGQITIDGANPSQVSPVQLASHIGYLPEKGAIFHGTIMENLTFFGTIPEKDALKAAEHLEVSEAVALLPNGYKTVLSDSVTDPIPPGLKQRISIARALATRPRIILFNNADRNLDRSGYNLVFRILGRLKKNTVLIIISDDRNILRLADKEYYIVNGKLEENAPVDSKLFSVLPFRELRA
ncbi:ABC-type bacteriocin/lantibiotic exporter [Desulfocapsa sulfexigens DSM 10523]|uniref:ABC-type bacteriocin/lantibiotic exporter n=1 Tax=Desulfocapsa sulfexigens (strain DSM 10523 / SB164P1) TaxID=1167006 RepID=M1NKC8_DESSD|nr:ABC transporter transmembrane domain-containing protein [Desulfocapsa sulfexigens]AGF80034.1 ABC-type bacteriocin/lantibiotic exporter [Desulfocapsa sulfexigens DSM 10523]